MEIMKILKIPIENPDHHDNPRIPDENDQNKQNHVIPQENH